MMEGWDEAPDGYPERPTTPQAARSGAFSYNDESGLRVNEFSRAPLSELKLLFRKNASSARRASATKLWVTAQLRFYGIPFRQSTSAAELKGLLQAAVRGGKCVEGGHSSLAAVEEKLAAEYAQKLQDHAQAVKKHEQDVEEWHKQQFATLGTPSKEANYDLGFFMAKYFVDEMGLPAPAKTPGPVILWDTRERSSLRERVDAVPGLCIQICIGLAVIAWAPQLEKGIDTAFSMIDQPNIKCDRPTLEARFDAERFLAKYFLDGRRGKPAPWKRDTPMILEGCWFSSEEQEKLVQAARDVLELVVQEASQPLYSSTTEDVERNCLLVGWREQVQRLVEDWDQEIPRLKTKNVEREKRKKLKELLAKLKPHIDYAKAHPNNPGPFTLAHLEGSYIVHCPSLAKESNVKLGKMTLDVQKPTSPHGAVAAFNLGLIEGTMLLATSEDALHDLREELSVRSSDEEDEDDEGDRYLPDTHKRKDPPSQTSKRISIKRRLGGGPSHPGRIYLQWAGCYTGESYLVLDEESVRTGYFDMDLSGVSARGQLNWGYFGYGKPIELALLKVSDTPKAKPDAFSSYCEKDRWLHW